MDGAKPTSPFETLKTVRNMVWDGGLPTSITAKKFAVSHTPAENRKTTGREKAIPRKYSRGTGRELS